VVVTFDRPMQRDVTRAAFSLRAVGNAEPVVGTIRWNGAGTQLTFTPAQWLEKSTGYRIGVDASAVGAQGAPLAGDFASTFATADSLEVVSSLPVGSDVALDSVVQIEFDRPVKPGTFLLTVRPAGEGRTAIAGTVEWDGDRKVQFTPQLPLLPQTTYVATIAGTLKAVDNTTLGANYVWRFQTHGLTRVVGYAPQGVGVKPAATITIRFDRPMNRASVEAGLQVSRVGTPNVRIAGQINWQDGDTQLTFRPLERLASLADYQVSLSRNAKSVDNLGLVADLKWVFQTAPSVEIVAFGPTGSNVGRDAVISVQFDKQMRRETVEEVFSIHGMGWETLRAIESRDAAWIVAVTLLCAVVTTACLVASDVAYGLLDPRVRERQVMRRSAA